MKDLVNFQGSMVSVDELAEHFRDDPEELLGFIEALGSEREARLARFLPFRMQVETLWQLLREATQVA